MIITPPNPVIPAADSVPVGTIIISGGNDTPSGYLLCNGSSISKTTYAALYAVIGGAYGESTTHFTLPNHFGLFGVDNYSPVGTSILVNGSFYGSIAVDDVTVGTEQAYGYAAGNTELNLVNTRSFIKY